MNAIKSKENYLEMLYEALDDCEQDPSTNPNVIEDLKKQIKELEDILGDMYHGI